MVLSEIIDTRIKSWSWKTDDISTVSLSLSNPKAEQNASNSSWEFHIFWCCFSPRLFTISPAVERQVLLTQGLTQRLLIATKIDSTSLTLSKTLVLYLSHNSNEVSLFSLWRPSLHYWNMDSLT